MGSIRNRGGVRRTETSGRIEALDSEMERRASARRYWPGRAPDWIRDAEEEEEDQERSDASLSKEGIAPAVVVKRKQPSVETDGWCVRMSSFRTAMGSNRPCRMDLVLTFNDPHSSKEGNPPEERHVHASDSSETSTEGSSEYETDTSAEEPEATRIRPMFVSKSQRKTETVAEEDEELVAEKRRKEAEERRRETQEMISRQLEEERRSREAARKVDVEDVNTDTEEDGTEEYEKWKERELKRLFRDQAIRDRERWDAEGEESQPNAADTETERPKLKFMQRYWHKGAFFQADKDDYAAPSIDQEVYKRDFSAPTGGDKFDKLKMPKVMQVRGDKFGRSGQSKYTHLVDQDTTDRELKKQLDKKVVRSNLKRMGGMKDSFEKPSKRCR